MSTDQMATTSPSPSPTLNRKPEVVIIGGGFGGVDAARALKKANVHVTLIDKRNYNLFVPLLYQVASSQLSPEHIAQPLRQIFRKQKNITIVFDEALDIDETNKQVVLAVGEPISYDYLIIAAGARDSYFGNDQWAEYAWGLKSLEDAERIQQQILINFELAEVAKDPAERDRLLTYVLVGGGPTGVEMAGAIAELSRYTLSKEFRNVDTRHTRIVLLEGLDRVLPPFDPSLSAAAQKSLEKLGIEVHTGAMVTGVDANGVEINNEERIHAGLVVWAAGIQGASINLGVADVAELDRGKRIIVTPELHVPGHPEIFVIGDTAHIPGPGGRPLPGVAQVAQQGGKHASTNILRAIAGEPYTAFVYKDYGSMATIGRNRAVAAIGGMKISGYPAWAVWAFIHIVRLMNFRNKVGVFFKWVWDYIGYNRSGRLIRNYNHPRNGQSE